MGERPTKPYWIDDLRRKHECYGYDDASTRGVDLEHEGRSIRLLMPEYLPPVSWKVASTGAELLFLIGEQSDQECEDGSIIEGGDGVLMVARKVTGRDDTYSVLVWHSLFPEALRRLNAMEL